MLPQLRELEDAFERELVVIGVHAGKFRTERVTENIRQAVLRLEVGHPVVNDRHFRIWSSYAVNAWPTIAILAPDGRHLGSHAGEFNASTLVPTIESIIKDFDSRGKLDRRSMEFRPECLAEPERPLAFPGKVLCTPDGRLFISDSNHNRVLAVRLQQEGTGGAVEEIVGGKAPGFADGDFRSAAFHHPQGLARIGERLYVADTGNHAIRALDFAAHTVTTVSGTGELARGTRAAGSVRSVALRSPWDILFHDKSLYIAMAGFHQIWRLDLITGEVRSHAGTGYEALADGPLDSCALAQPSGLATDSQRLYFADSESSSIRWADLQSSGRVETVVGTGLFDFGDVDGTGDSVRLQHPLGVVWLDGKLYVADTYNNKIKLVDPATRASVTFLGTGEAGDRDGESPTFDEPGGISAWQSKLYIADTNNHRIRVADVPTRRVSTLEIQGL